MVDNYNSTGNSQMILHHVTLMVVDIDEARQFYTRHFGMEEIPKSGLDYGGSFLRINETQELHLAALPDQEPSFRGHLCLRVEHFMGHFRTFKELGILDLTAWGKIRELDGGIFQFYIRDPAGNLVELNSRPEERDAIVEAGLPRTEEWGGRPYRYWDA